MPDVYYVPFRAGDLLRDGGSSAAGVISVVVGQSGPVNISDNVVANSSRSGITYRGAINVNIVHNDVSGAGLDTTDLGGIYAWGEDVSSLSSNSNIIISYNTVHDMQSGIETGPGIYADNGNSGVTIEHNIVYNANYGIQVSSGGMKILVEYNTLDATKPNSFNPTPSAIHSGAVAYYNPTTNTIVNGPAGIRYNTIALYNNFGVKPDPSGIPGSSSTADTTDTLYGFNVDLGIAFSVTNGNNVAVAYTSNGLGQQPSTIGPTNLKAVAQAGSASIYEDLGANLGNTVPHDSDTHHFRVRPSEHILRRHLQ